MTAPRDLKKCHALAVSRKTELPEHMIFFDTETNQIAGAGEIRQTLKLGWACYVRRSRKTEQWFDFKDNDIFWDWVTAHAHRKQRLHIIAHNAGFDALIADTYYKLPERGWKLSRFYDESTTYICIWKKENKTIVFIDTMNYFKTSVAGLGESLGIPKMKINFDTCTDQELSVYCKNDVHIIKEGFLTWLKFHKDHDLGNFAFTIAGQSLNTFRHKFMRDNARIMIHDNMEVYALERASYFGGRTECFHVGRLDHELFTLDVNSMYPAVMLSELYPRKLLGYMLDLSPAEAEKLLKKYLLIAEVEVETPDPIFPFKMKNKLIFPVGKFTCTLATPELREGLKRGYIKKIIKCSVYEPSNLFEEYVSYFYGMRLAAKENNNELFVFFYKLFLNSLYGKFGQRMTGWEIIGYTDDLNPKRWIEYDADTGERNTYRQFAGCVQMKNKIENEAFDSFPAIASHVTSYARLKLWKYIEAAGPENVFYCDTDSLFTNSLGLDKLTAAGVLDNKELGMLKLEKTSEFGIFYGLKDYALADKVKIKGVKKEFTGELDEQGEPKKDFILLGHDAAGKPIYKQQQWKRLSGLIADGDIKTHKIVDMKKTLKREYDKGTVTGSGRVQPFKLPEYLDELERVKQLEINFQGEKIEYSIYEKLSNDMKKEFRKAILSLGGVNDQDYPNLPKWCRRKTGSPIDELVGEIASFGYYVETADELYNLILENTG